MRGKQLSRLTDWFDCLVVLSAGAPSPEALRFSAGFSAQAWVWMDGRSIAPAHQAGRFAEPVELACPLDGADGAEQLLSWLRSRHLKRPLFWVEGSGFRQLLEAYPHAFSVTLQGGQVVEDGPWADLTLDRLPATDTAGETAWLERTHQDILQAVQTLLDDDKALNVLVLYDDQFTYVSTIHEHLDALKQYSRHNVHFLPGSNHHGHYDYQDRWPEAWDLGVFDAIVWHYSIRAAHERHIYDALAEKLARFTGLKVLFIQDEYDDLHVTWDWIRRVGINLVMSCAPNMTSARGLYPERELPGIETLLTLTGYVPEDQIEQFYTPLEERALRIAYRGRTLPYQYGTLGQEKFLIGVDMRRLAQERGVAVDIEVDEDSRIYGDDWYRFVGSARATLASESGSLAADFDGELKHKAAKAMAEGQPFEDFRNAHLLELETVAPINVVSPKIFEAIRLRTALVCFEGTYSGVIEADRHYIPLKKDYSNVDEVLAKLEDLDLLKAMTERAYQDVIETGAYSYRTFVRQFDDILSGRSLRPWRIEIISAPILRRPRASDQVTAIRYGDSIEYALNATVLRKGYQAPEIALEMHSLYQDIDVFYQRRGLQIFRMHRPSAPPEDAFRRWRIGPDSLTITNASLLDGARLTLTDRGAQVVTVARPGRYAVSARIDLSGVDLEQDFCWVRVALRDVEGELRVCLWDAVTLEPGPDIILQAHPGEQEVFFEIDGETPYSGLLFRSSEFAGIDDPAGAGVFVEAEMLIVSQYEPRFRTMARNIIANPNNAFGARFDPESAGREDQPAHLPPRSARVLRAMPAEDLFSIEYWRNRGAGLEPAENGQRLITPSTAFTYAAAVRLDLSEVDFRAQACWIKILLTDVKGAVQVGLSSADGKVFACETNLPRMTVEGAVYFRIDDPVGDLLMFRTGPLDQPGEAVFLGAELLVGPPPRDKAGPAD